MASLLVGIEEIEQATPHAAHRRNFKFAGPDLLPERRVVQLLGAVERCRRTLDLQSDGAHGWPVRDVVRMGEAFFFLVDDKIDCALRPARHGLRFVVGNVAKSQAGNELLELVGGSVIDRKFDELDAKAFRSWRHLRNIGTRFPAFRAQLIHQIDQTSAAHRQRPSAASRRGTGR